MLALWRLRAYCMTALSQQISHSNITFEQWLENVDTNLLRSLSIYMFLCVCLLCFW